MNPKNNIQPPHERMLRLFLDEYPAICKHMDPSCQERLTEIAPLAFAKWYYTTLSTDTLLSPANVIWHDLQTKTPGCPFTAYTMAICEDKESPARYTVSPIMYALDKHPLIEDLRVITNFCVPDRKMDEHLFFIEEDRKLLLSQLSQKYDYYLEYLTRLAWWMGLFIYLPAIHTKKIQRAPFCDAFFANPPEDLLKLTANAACELAAERFSFSMDLEQGIATPSFFKACLRIPQETDHIFIDFYNQVDVNIEEIWQIPPENLTEEEGAIISSFLFTGIMLDKWFLFPMSVFFGLLNPISFAPLRYTPFINNLAALITMDHNIGAEIFIPPSYYALTPLGQALFGQEDALKEKYTLPADLPFGEVCETIEKEIQIHRFEEVFYMGATQDILTVKISRQRDPAQWKIIEAEGDTAVDEICLDLCAAFTMEELGRDYMLSIPDENNFPVDYSPQGSKRSVNKTTNRTLGELWLTKGLVMTLVPGGERSSTLTIEVLSIAPGNPHILYPRVCAQSPKITALEKIDEIF